MQLFRHFISSPLVFLIPAVALAAPPGSGGPNIDHVVALRELALRAAPESPSGDYAPATVTCPNEKPTIRSAANLSSSEREWLQKRRANTVDPMVQFFQNSGLTDFDGAAFVNAHAENFSVLPNIGLAVSGGGYRALMNGAGFLAAADERVPGSTDSGGIGHLLQASTYLAGLSGGGWLVGSMFANNFSTVVQLRDGYADSALWDFQNSIFEGPETSGLSILNMASYWENVVDQIGDKRDAGYDVSITDTWGRALSYQLINARDGGPTYTFSSIADWSNFTDADTPMPILVADERLPHTTVVAFNSTVVEFNPWEIGSFDPTIYGFAPTRYVGSNFSAGSIVSDGGHCVEGFDQYGYVMGTSSSLFNSFMLQNLDEYNIPSIAQDLIESILTSIDDAENDIAVWKPNPFHKWNAGSNVNSEEDQLTLVDGGMDLQNIPLHPLIQPVRGVDVIFAVDSSADTTYSWPNGTALRASYERSQEDIANGTAFPAVPDAETFINLGLNQKPTFFGCDTSEFKNATSIPPLIVYLPNTPYTQYSNVSTFNPSYDDWQRNSIIKNGYNVATMGNGTVDAKWPACAACAVLHRSLERVGTEPSATCKDCMSRYCWAGNTDSTPVTSFEPTTILDLDVDSAGVSLLRGGLPGGAAWIAVAVAGLAAAVC